jgi:hypothetical protein
MDNTQKIYVATLMAATFLAGSVALGASAPSVEPDQKVAAVSATPAENDFGKLSVDGASALNDVSRTRLAIFDGRVDDAKKYVGLADAAFTKAKTDDTAFTKAESDLNPRPGAEAKSPDTKTAEQLKSPIAWLPVDQSITIDEDYTDNPAKKAAVADANQSLKAGDRKAAMDKLKLADIKIAATVAVVPLEQTLSKVKEAAGLINDGKYYEASQDLRQAQDAERFYTVGNVGTPKE